MGRRIYTRIGARIAELGSQKHIASLLRLTQQTVSKKLRGETAISLDDLENLAKAANVSFTWFFAGYSGKDYPNDILMEPVKTSKTKQQ